MCMRRIFLMCFSVTCFAADQRSPKPIENYGDALLGMFAIGLYAGSEWKAQQKIQHVTSSNAIVDESGRQGVEFAYTPEQRSVALARQQGIAVGFISTLGLVMHSGTPFNIIKGITPHSLFTQLLAPTVVYNVTKEFLDNTYVHTSSLMRSGIAGVAACTLPKFFLSSGISPEHMLIHACLTHLLTHRANIYRHTPVLGHVIDSCARASQVVPLMHMITRKYSVNPAVFAFRPGTTELMQGIIPGLVYVGVDLGFNTFAVSSAGKMIENKVLDPVFDIVAKPLPEKAQKPFKQTTKKVLAEGFKIGTTATILVGAKSVGLL